MFSKVYILIIIIINCCYEIVRKLLRYILYTHFTIYVFVWMGSSSNEESCCMYFVHMLLYYMQLCIYHNNYMIYLTVKELAMDRPCAWYI